MCQIVGFVDGHLRGCLWHLSALFLARSLLIFTFYWLKMSRKCIASCTRGLTFMWCGCYG